MRGGAFRDKTLGSISIGLSSWAGSFLNAKRKEPRCQWPGSQLEKQGKRSFDSEGSIHTVT